MSLFKLQLLKNMKLSTKTAIAISTVLIFIFIILISFTISFTGKAIHEGIYGEISSISKSNALQVQHVLDSTQATANDMNSYIQEQYDRNITQSSTESTSIIYKKPISNLNSDIEKYITATAKHATISSPDIVGVGVMFEPYQFDKNIESYAFYRSEGDLEDEIKPFGTYAEYSKENYYALAAKSKRIVFSKPYVYNGITMITAETPIIYKNELKGVIMSDFDVSHLTKLDSKNENYPSLYTTVFDQNSILIYDSQAPEDIGKDMTQFYANGHWEKVTEKMQKGKPFSMKMTNVGTKVTGFFYPIKAGNDTWWSLTEVSLKDMNKTMVNTALWLIIICSMALALIVVLIVIVIKKMLNPIQNIVKAATDISNGNFDIELEVKSNDEIGILTQTFKETASKLKNIIHDVAHVLNNIAIKNLDVEVNANHVGQWAQIENSMNHIINNLNHVIHEINQTSDQVSIGSNQVSIGAQTLSQGATEQAGSLQELSATITEVSENIKKNAEYARVVNEETINAGIKIGESNQQIDKMITAITEISHKSNEISKIIKTIEDIAFQTNILALNAAVEAARAGSAGKGFAVVADEVRNLAKKSAEAAKSTTVLIGETVEAVESGTQIASETAQSMAEVVKDAEKISTFINEIAKASETQATAVSQVTQGVNQISAVVQANSATAEESAAASEELSAQAQILKDMVHQFKLKDDNEI